MGKRRVWVSLFSEDMIFSIEKPWGIHTHKVTTKKQLYRGCKIEDHCTKLISFLYVIYEQSKNEIK